MNKESGLTVSEKKMLTRARNGLTIYLSRVEETIHPRGYVSVEDLGRYFRKGTLKSARIRGIGKKTMELLGRLFPEEIKIGGEHMTETEYNAAEGVRRSDLWKMNDSPEKFRWFLEHPVEQTPAMAFGSACHKMILEPETFGNEYAIAPEINRRTNAGKAEWEAFCEANAGKTIISADDAETMREMEEALEQCSLARSLIREDGQTEVPLFWTDQDTGEKCKVKCDRVIRGLDGKYCVVDYKTTSNADTERFNHDVFKMGYYLQAAMYTEGLMQALQLDYRPTFLFVAQEKKAPYSLNVIEVTEDVMNVGIAKFHELLGKLHDCKVVDIYPGYVDDVPNETQLPGWWSLEGEDE